MDNSFDFPMMGYLKSLEGRSNLSRCQQILDTLDSLGIKSSVQECRWPKIKNVTVDFLPQETRKKVLFSAHFDAVKGSPGANDNASGAAVLLGLCLMLRKNPLPVRVIFFDREEAWLRTPIFRLGLLGSLYYAATHKLNDISTVYNVEYCGLGNSLCVWPIGKRDELIPAVKAAEKVAAALHIDLITARVPWLLMSSDHLSFRLKRFPNSVTLSLLPGPQVPMLERMISGLKPHRLLDRRKLELPEPLASIHTMRDTSSLLQEESLQLMLRVLHSLAKHSVQRDQVVLSG